MTISPKKMSGAMELLPAEQVYFDRIRAVIETRFMSCGFVNIETPSIERSEVLLSKEGGETARQVYFVQSTGGLLAKSPAALALRFDLTVPLARYVSEHFPDLHFPFKRFQIQKVYRGERAQAGRFREFYQCDIDVVGHNGLPIGYDAELPSIIYAIFKELEIEKFTIHINNRKFVRGFLEGCGISSDIQLGALREIDKLAKRGARYVEDALVRLGLSRQVVDEVMGFAQTISRSYREAYLLLNEIHGDSPDLMAGKAELLAVLLGLETMGVPDSHVALDFSVMRGLDYYTGTVYETFIDDCSMLGSICSGGRYDNLAGQFTRQRMPGVGISIGLSRLFWRLQQEGRVGGASSGAEVLVACFECLPTKVESDIACSLRAQGIKTYMLFDSGELKKQLKFAVRIGAQFVVFADPDGRAEGTVSVRDIIRRYQISVHPEMVSDAIADMMSASG